MFRSIKESRKKHKGFTLLEIIIVVIIIGILASIALPKYTQTVEYARAVEALLNLGSLRQALNRFYLKNSNSYTGATFGDLDLVNPNTEDRRMFNYTLNITSPVSYLLNAIRKTDSNSYIAIDQSGKKIGGGTYSSITDP